MSMSTLSLSPYLRSSNPELPGWAPLPTVVGATSTKTTNGSAYFPSGLPGRAPTTLWLRSDQRSSCLSLSRKVQPTT